MRELPCLMNGHGVRATLDGRKTQTRRPVKPQPPEGARMAWACGVCAWELDGAFVAENRNPLGVPGDLLYVRETWHELPDRRIGYRASPETNNWGPFCMISTWRASIHMPKICARLWLLNTGVRVERIQDITEEDVLAEGVRHIDRDDSDYYYTDYWESQAGRYTCPLEAYAYLWDSIYDKRGLGWDVNPFVFVTSYEVTER